MRPICYAIVNSDGFYNHMVSKAISSTGSRKRIHLDVSIKYSLAFPLDRFIVDRFCSHYSPIMKKTREEQQKRIEDKFAEAIEIARSSRISLDKLTELLTLMYQEDE